MNVAEAIIFFLTILVIALILLVLSPILIPLFVVIYIKENVQERYQAAKFIKFLAENPGTKYFAYTSRQTSCNYVRENILPYLPPDTNIVYLTDKDFNLGNDYKFLYRLVLKMKTTGGGFPYMSQISDGDLVTRSINNQLYSAIQRKIGADHIVQKIGRFFEKPATIREVIS